MSFTLKKYRFKVKYFGEDKEKNIYFSFKENSLEGFLLNENNFELKEFLKQIKIFSVKLQLDKYNNEYYILYKNSILFQLQFLIFKLLKFAKQFLHYHFHK